MLTQQRNDPTVAPMSGIDHEFNLEPIAEIIMAPRWQASALRQKIVAVGNEQRLCLAGERHRIRTDVTLAR
jgi:hypothetical protein